MPISDYILNVSESPSTGQRTSPPIKIRAFKPQAVHKATNSMLVAEYRNTYRQNLIHRLKGSANPEFYVYSLAQLTNELNRRQIEIHPPEELPENDEPEETQPQRPSDDESPS